MTILSRLLKPPKEKPVLVQCYLCPKLLAEVKEKINAIDKTITISGIIRVSLEEFLEETKNEKS